VYARFMSELAERSIRIEESVTEGATGDSTVT